MTERASELFNLLQKRGVVTPAEVRSRLSISAPTLSRAVAALGSRIVALGSTNQRRLALPRSLRHLGFRFPVMKVSLEGDVLPLGELFALQGDGYWFEDHAGGASKLYPGLPYFIDDMRPAGFLGRHLCQREARVLDLPPHLNDWTHEHALMLLASRGEDCVGNLIIGEESLLRYWQWREARNSFEDADAVRAMYPQRARAAIAGAPVGSSAAGEWPKFTSAFRVGDVVKHVIVKFSPPLSDALAQRQGDLLLAEHWALQTLAVGGYRAASSQALVHDDRVFLEVERFDRLSAWGRRGVISLQSFDGEFYGRLDNWANMADRLEQDRYISAQDARSMRLFEAFGRLIGNSDRHFGNLSLHFAGIDDVCLAPIYDMLPMFYMPRDGQLLNAMWKEALPSANLLTVWPEAAVLAKHFWNSVMQDVRISESFRLIAQQHLAGL